MPLLCPARPLARLRSSTDGSGSRAEFRVGGDLFEGVGRRGEAGGESFVWVEKGVGRMDHVG